MNVVQQDDVGKETVGAPRNFMLVDLHGGWYAGWQKIEFSPSRKENAFLEDKKLWTGNTVFFESFVHPNRWVSFYGRWYLLTKLLVMRLKMEASFCAREIESLKFAGFALPTTGPDAEKDWSGSTVVGASKSIPVPAFEAEVDGVAIGSTFPPFGRSEAGIVAAKQRLLKLRFNDVPALSFAIRATELAFSNKARCFEALPKLDDKGVIIAGSEGEAPEAPFPSWISGAKWDRAHKIKRTSWNRLVINQQVPFKEGLSLRYRVHHKAERVAA